jgi:hypothetical protein
MDRDWLEAQLTAGRWIESVARELGKHPSTVGHWVTRYGLASLHAARHAAKGAPRRRCRSEAVTAHRRRVKELLIEEAGGCCVICGYDRFPGALQFHHVDPAQKSFALSVQGVARSLEKARAEAAKCVLMCANCHAELEGGVATIRL